MAIAHIHLLSVVVALLSASSAVPQGVPPRPAKIRLQFLLTDGWGHPIQRALIQVHSPGGPPKTLHYPEEGGLVTKPGSYTVIVDSQGFLRLERVVNANQPEMLMSLCLTVAPIEGLGDRALSLIGHVAKHFMSEQPVWVRLMGLYCDRNATALVNTAGSFVLPGLQPGRYQLMLFSGGELKDSRQVDIRAFDTKVSIE